MLKFAITNKKPFVTSIMLLTNEIAKKVGLPQSPQFDYQQLPDDRSIVEETDPIPPYDDPLY
jgi:hypothetical protein